jgi:hypothetical protein
MFGDMAKMAKQVMEMKAKMSAVENELKKTVITGSAKDGSIDVEITGKMKLNKVTVNTLPKDQKALEKAIFEATDAAMTQVTNLAQDKLKGVTGGINIPGLT